MNEIVKVRWLGKDIREIWFRNGPIARKFQPGQFLIIHKNTHSERIPLTIVETAGDLVRIIVQKVGYSTRKLCLMEVGEMLRDVAGPLGKPTEVSRYGNVLCIAGGIGAAPLKPVAAGLKQAGNSVTIIEGVRCREYLIMDDELSEIADRFILTSDDGTAGEKGLVTVPFRKMLENNDIPDFVFAVGPPVMMHAVSKITKQHSIPLTVSLNPIMVDGTGMCGACRVEVAGETRFACVDGPEFDGNQVNFELLIKRLIMYEKEEKIIMGEDCCG